MSYYLAFGYVGISCILSGIYALIEFIKEKGTFTTTTKTILISWVCFSLIMGSCITSVGVAVMSDTISPVYALIIGLIVCISLIISSFMVCYP